MSTDTETSEKTTSFFDVIRLVLLVVLIGFAVWYYLIRKEPLPNASIPESSDATVSPGDVLHVRGTTMGTVPYSVKVADWTAWERNAPDGNDDAGVRSEQAIATESAEELAERFDETGRELQTLVQTTLDRVDQTMSTYRPDSEISRFNASDSTDWFAVSAETARVVKIALDVSEFTSGMFDVTVGPLVNRWGFGPEKHRTPPTQREIDELLERVGFEHLSVRETPPALKKDVPGLSVDLSGIAKGFAVDAVAEALEKRGSRHYLIEVGGETRTCGEKAPQTPWSVGVSIPTPLWLKEPRIQRIAQLGSRSMATSGDYLNFIDYEGMRFSHIIDPRTGWPVEKRNADLELPDARLRLGSVSVVDESCVKADALTKGFYLLGVEEGLKLADAHGIAVLFFLRREQVPSGGASGDSDVSFTIEEVASRAFKENVSSRKVGKETVN